MSHKNSGIAVLLSDFSDGCKTMYIGKHFSGKTFYDYMNNCQEKVIIDENGNGNFKVKSGSVSVWLEQL